MKRAAKQRQSGVANGSGGHGIGRGDDGSMRPAFLRTARGRHRSSRGPPERAASRRPRPRAGGLAAAPAFIEAAASGAGAICRRPRAESPHERVVVANRARRDSGRHAGRSRRQRFVPPPATATVIENNSARPVPHAGCRAETAENLYKDGTYSGLGATFASWRHPGPP